MEYVAVAGIGFVLTEVIKYAGSRALASFAKIIFPGVIAAVTSVLFSGTDVRAYAELVIVGWVGAVLLHGAHKWLQGRGDESRIRALQAGLRNPR